MKTLILFVLMAFPGMARPSSLCESLTGTYSLAFSGGKYLPQQRLDLEFQPRRKAFRFSLHWAGIEGGKVDDGICSSLRRESCLRQVDSLLDSFDYVRKHVIDDGDQQEGTLALHCARARVETLEKGLSAEVESPIH